MYKKNLIDIRWQKKRLKIFERDNWECQECGNNAGEMHIHHLKYVTRFPWGEDNKNLITLCSTCHTKKHNPRDRLAIRIKQRLDRMKTGDIDSETLQTLLKKYFGLFEKYEPEGGAQFYKRQCLAEDIKIQKTYDEQNN